MTKREQGRLGGRVSGATGAGNASPLATHLQRVRGLLATVVPSVATRAEITPPHDTPEIALRKLQDAQRKGSGEDHAMRGVVAAVQRASERTALERLLAGGATMFSATATPLAGLALLVTGALALVGVSGEGAVSHLVLEVPFLVGLLMATILLLWLLAVVFSERRGSGARALGVLIAVGTALLVLVATWIPTQAAGPQLAISLPTDTAPHYVVAATGDRLQADEQLTVTVTDGMLSGTRKACTGEQLFVDVKIGPGASGTASVTQNFSIAAAAPADGSLCATAVIPARCALPRLGNSCILWLEHDQRRASAHVQVT